MPVIQRELQLFILTRFNLLLWNKDKAGRRVRSIDWLEHRFYLFEKFSYPSIKNQTCQDFVWIVLFDSFTPEKYRKRISEYQKECPQFVPVWVEPEKGRFFAEIFRREIQKKMCADRVLSTYFDNDDALCLRFVEDLQQRASKAKDGTFINYNDGYQFYEEDGFLMQIHYPTNHFVSVIEKGDRATVKGIFGYGGHSYIERIPGVNILHVKHYPMWCEVVHGKNMINDAYFLLNAKLINDEYRLMDDFAIDELVKGGVGIYVLKFFPRYIKTFIRRTKHFLFGRNW